MPDWRITRLRGEFCVTWDEIGIDGEPVRRRYRLGTSDKAEAARRAPARYAELTRPKGKTVADLWDGYVKDREGRAVLRGMEYTKTTIMPSFGHLDGEAVTIAHCRQHVAKRRDAKISDGTIHTEMGHLRTVLLWGEAHKLIAKAPPIERPAKPAPKTDHLTKPQVEKLISHAKVPHIATAIHLLIGTGARVTAALELTWDRVDFARGIINLRNPFDKTARKGRAVVPMNASLRTALLGAKSHALSAYVVEYAGKPVRSIKKGIKAAARSAGIADVSPHVFRHSAAVWMAEAGTPMSEISQYLGHGDSRITERVYARFSPTHLRRASAALELG